MQDKEIGRRAFLRFLTLLAAGAGLGATNLPGFAKNATGSALLKESITGSRVPLLYSPGYNITAYGLEFLHPFDGSKFAKIQKKLIDGGFRREAEFVRPQPLSPEQLLVVHSPRYLDSLKKSLVLARIFEIPAAVLVPGSLLDSRVLQPMRLASGGTLFACRLAIEQGIAINIGGGYHHADHDRGGGFCVYSDIPIALQILKSENKIKRALIVDTDAHQGNGFANVIRNSGWAFGLDLFDESIYPFPKVQEDIAVPLPKHSKGEYYQNALEKALPEALSQFRPDLVVYNAGSDVLKSDPLSTLQLAQQDVKERDLYVVSSCRKRNIPVAMVLAGGYSKESASAHALSIQTIVESFDSQATTT